MATTADRKSTNRRRPDVEALGLIRDAQPRVGWWWAPNAIFDLRLKIHTFGVYCYLRRLADRDGVSWPKQRTIANALQLSLTTVKIALAELVERKLLHIEGEPGRVATYTLLAVPQVTHEPPSRVATQTRGGYPTGDDLDAPRLPPRRVAATEENTAEEKPLEAGQPTAGPPPLAASAPAGRILEPLTGGEVPRARARETTPSQGVLLPDEGVAGTNGHAVGHGAGPAQPTATPTAEASDPEEDRPADQATAVRVLSHWRTLWFEHTRQPYKPDAEERRRGLHNLRHLIGRHGEGEVIRCMEWAFMAGKNIYWPTVSAFATSATIMRIQAESSASGRSTSKTANNHANMMALADRLEREAKTIDAEVIR